MSCGGSEHNGEIVKTNGSAFAFGYFLHKMDESAFPRYYLFIGNTGCFYIMQEDSSGNCLYTRNEFSSRGKWSNAWANRATLKYGPWDDLF